MIGSEYILMTLPKVVSDLIAGPAYHLKRVPTPPSVDDGMRLLKAWQDEDGRHAWAGASDKERRHAFKHWRFLRHLHRAQIRARGGRDDG